MRPSDQFWLVKSEQKGHVSCWAEAGRSPSILSSSVTVPKDMASSDWYSYEPESLHGTEFLCEQSF